MKWQQRFRIWTFPLTFLPQSRWRLGLGQVWKYPQNYFLLLSPMSLSRLSNLWRIVPNSIIKGFSSASSESIFVCTIFQLWAMSERIGVKPLSKFSVQGSQTNWLEFMMQTVKTNMRTWYLSGKRKLIFEIEWSQNCTGGLLNFGTACRRKKVYGNHYMQLCWTLAFDQGVVSNQILRRSDR